MQTIAIASVMLTKTEPGPGFNESMTTTTHTLHYRSNVNKNEMIGIATTNALVMKPGFAVNSIIVDIVELPGPPTADDDYNKG